MFGDKLKRLRIDKNLTQQDLAKILKVSPSAIGMYEQGRREPDKDILKNIANYFDVTTDYLLDRQVYELIKEENSLFGDLRSKYSSEKMIKTVPILGTIRAGIPLLASENWGTQIEIPSDLNADFALKVCGDSMSWVGIHDGDLAILRQCNTAMHGDIVACGVQDGDWCATLKFFIQENGTPVLRAANPSYEDIPITNKHRIIGQLVSVQKEPPMLSTYKSFLVEKELSNKGWSEAIEKAVQSGFDSDKVVKMIELFSHSAKQLK